MSEDRDLNAILEEAEVATQVGKIKIPLAHIVGIEQTGKNEYTLRVRESKNMTTCYTIKEDGAKYLSLLSGVPISE